MQKTHILFVSYDGMTDPLGQSQVLPYIREISKSNFRYTLISFEKQERYVKFSEVIFQFCNDSNIQWIPIKYADKIPILATIWNIIRLQKKVFELHKKDPFDLFHSRSHVPSLVAQKLQKKESVPYVFDMRGFWADERVDGGVWKLNNPIFKKIFTYFKKKELEFLQEANAIVSLTHNGKNEICSWNILQTKTLDIEVIPCCVDTDLFSNENVNTSILSKMREELSIKEDQFVLGYVGSIGTWYMLPEMLDFFRELKVQKPDALFLFITNEAAEKIITHAKSKNIAPEDLRVTSCLHKDVPTYISLFTISIYFIIPAYSKKASSPTKQGELMAMGIPIVCNANVGDADKVIADTNSGWVIHTFNEESYKKTVYQILNKPLPDKQNIINQGNKEFNLQTGALKFRNTYERILGTYRH
jgi:glycosyltransferase involved in cell wall biosynthesis